jgi:outer membrane protein TolC
LSAVPAIIEAHPLFRRSDATIDTAAAAVDDAHRGRFPELGVSVQDWLGRQNGTHDLRVLLSMQLPLFDEPRISRAETARDAANADRTALELDLRARLVAARAEYLASARRARAEIEEALPAAEEAADLSGEAYRVGALDLTGTLSAEQALSDARDRTLTARADRAMAHARLLHASGVTGE